jgi:tetratricopeptide (TPR) repeat protein
VSDSCQSLKHLPFFEELAKSEDHDPTWKPVAAGLVVMRLLDEWIVEGSAVTQADSWGVAAVREAIAAVPETTPLRRILSAIVDGMVSASVGDIHALSPRLMAFAQALEYEARWSVAADVYETIVAHADPTDDADLVVSAHIQLAACLRQTGDLDGSAASYGAAGRVASAAGDLFGVLRARVGDAKTAIARGNMPRAEAILESTIAGAQNEGLRSVQSQALHERALVAGLRGQFEPSIKFAYAALELAPSQREKDRILNDIATSFMYLGLLDVARDGYLVLASTAQEQYVRWLAELNLIEIAAKQGAELQFDKYRRDLENADFSPQLRIVYLTHVGRGYHAMGQSTNGIPYLERATELAEEYGFNQMLFEAEQALAEARSRAATVTVVAPTSIAQPIREIIVAIGEMKSLAGVR